MELIRNKGCRMCGENDFKTVIDMGVHPLVNSLVAKEDLHKEDPRFPLVVKQCMACSLVQLVEIVDAHDIYKGQDYLFYSSDMPGLSKYFADYVVQDVIPHIDPGDLVVEIGSNDGVLLQHLVEDYEVLGVDPSTNVALRAIRKGIPTVPLFFTEDLARQIVNEYEGKAKAIVANNCIAHLNGLDDLMRGVSRLLADDGVFILECNYWGGMVVNGNYSLIYHDHYSYFSAHVWESFARKFGMRPFDAWVTPAQGGSLRLFLCKDKRLPTRRYMDLLKQESVSGLNTYATSLQYEADVRAAALALRDGVLALKADGKTIAGYGAAAKGFTILTMSSIGAEHISYFVDDSPAKQGKYTPVEHIPIITRAQAEAQPPDVFLVLAPNYAKVIIEKEQAFLKAGGTIVVPFGRDIRIVTAEQPL
jgi:novobiocin biosynthesis protein NovU/D-mycarose 3-C-methyltransferase